MHIQLFGSMPRVAPILSAALLITLLAACFSRNRVAQKDARTTSPLDGLWHRMAGIYGLADHQMDHTKGLTMQRTCESSPRGATYAQAEVFPDGVELRSWDRGWVLRGKQVCSAVQGPYVFKNRREAGSFSE